MSKAKKVLVIIAVVLVLILVAGLVATFAANMSYITINGKRVKDSANGIVLIYEPVEIGVHLKEDYTVQIVPNVVKNQDIKFYVDDEIHSFQEETDLTDGFNIVKKDKSFTVQPKGNLQVILQAMYPDKTVTAQGYYDDMFKLIVTTKDSKDSYTLYFALAGVQSIVLDKEEIKF